MHTRSFTAHLKRAFATPTLYICILLYAAMLLGTTFGSRTNGGWTTMALLKQAQTDFIRILSTVVPALAYAVTYVDDYNNKLFHHWTVRSGVRSYAVSYYFVSMLSAFVVSFVGSALFMLVMHLRGFPMEIEGLASTKDPEFGFYGAWYHRKQLLAYVSAALSEYALGCAAMAGFAAACSAVLRRKISSMVIPVLYFYGDQVLRKLAGYIPQLKKLLSTELIRKMNLSQLVNMSVLVRDIAPLPMYNLLFKILTFALFAIAFGTITVWSIERSAENA